MQIPKRKSGKYTDLHEDPHITEEKFKALQHELERKINVSRRDAASDVERFALLGDFSENAAYSSAKSRLRGINQRILEIEDLLKRAVIIPSGGSFDIVRLGSVVTVESNGTQKIFQILGSAEVSPLKGIISHNSPVGSALIGHTIGDVITIKLADVEIQYKIISIE